MSPEALNQPQIDCRNQGGAGEGTGYASWLWKGVKVGLRVRGLGSRDIVDLLQLRD